MLDPEDFSRLSFESFFPDRAVKGRKVYLFDVEYWDGLWHCDRAPGVDFLLPEADRKQLGVLMLSHPFEPSSAPRHVLQPDPDEMRRRAGTVLEALDLPFRFGDAPAKVKALAGGKQVKTERIRESKSTRLFFRCGQSGAYRLLAGFGHKEGLGSLEIARLDLVRANAAHYKSGGKKRK
jgi:hypothetical protein